MSLFDQTRRLSILKVGANQKFKPQPVFTGPPIDRFDGIDVRGAVTATLFIAPGEGPPVPPEPTTLSTFSAGYTHGHAIKKDGSLWAWGNNALGRTGLNKSTLSTAEPERVGADNDWATVSAGNTHSLAVRTDGSLWTWGDNSNARTGLGLTSGSLLVPTRIGEDNDWAAVSAGDSHSLAVKTNGRLWSWGNNEDARTGIAISTGNTLFPTQNFVFTNTKKISAGLAHSFYAREPDPDPDPDPEFNFSQSLYTWGTNRNGRTGRGITTGTTSSPTRVNIENNWDRASAGDTHSLAVKTDGTLWSWGSNAFGKTGLDTASGDTTTPTQVGTSFNWKNASAGVESVFPDIFRGHSLAVKTDGTIWSWGSNINGRTGQETTTGSLLVPTKIGNDDNWSEVSAGNSWSLAIKTDGTLWSWGSNGGARTGQNTTSGNTITPSQIGTDDDWKTEQASNGSAGPRIYKLWAYVDKIGWGVLEQGEVPERGIFRSINCAPFDKLYIETDTADAVQIGVGTL